jgi:two-component system response regulator PilR (NtrC family)
LNKYGNVLGRPMRGVTTEAMQRLTRHRWVGNIRELENVIQRAIALASSDLVDVDALPPSLQTDSLIEAASDVVLPPSGVDLDAVIDRLEKNLLLQALERSHGVRKEAARLLGISFRSLRTD